MNIDTADPPLLLDYAFSSDPAPIPVSTAQVTNQARVNIGVAANPPGAKVFCSKIAVVVPVDSGTPSSDSLFAQPPAGSVSTGKWAISGATRRGSELGPGLVADQVYTEFIYTNKDSSTPIDYNLVLGLFGAVSPLVGDATIQILEVSGTDPGKLETRQGTFTLSKVLPEFYLKNLIATSGEDSSKPITEFRKGAPIYLTWESNGTYFQLFAKGQRIWQGTSTNVLLADGVVADTTFILVASMTGDPDQDSPQGGYEPIYLYEALTVTVSDPVLTPTSVTVSDQTTMNTATVHGSLSVLGGSTLNGLAVNGPLTVADSASMEAVTVKGLSGKFGPVALFHAPMQLAYDVTVNPTSFQARTDGFVMLRLVPPTAPTTNSINVWGTIHYKNSAFDLFGGQVRDQTGRICTNASAITVPIQAGTHFLYQGRTLGSDATEAASQDANWRIEVIWFPFGTVPSDEPTTE